MSLRVKNGEIRNNVDTNKNFTMHFYNYIHLKYNKILLQRLALTSN